jgi:hypothetical protein
MTDSLTIEEESSMMEEIASIISESRSLSSTFVSRTLRGALTTDDISTYDLYDSLFRLRHDYVHWSICRFRGIKFGEVKLKDIPELSSLCSGNINWPYIMNQSPDIITISNKNVNITEVTITGSRLARREKISKYSLLVDTLRKSGFFVELEIICVSSTSSHPEGNSLIEDHGLDVITVDQIYRIMHRINKQIHLVESTSMGQEWYIRRNNQTFYDIDMGITNSQIMDYYAVCKNKPFLNEGALKNFIDTDFDSELNQEDIGFLNKVIDKAEVMDSKLLSSDDFTKSMLSLISYHDKYSNTKKMRSIFPLPYMRSKTTDSSIRDTSGDYDMLLNLRGKLHVSRDPLLSKIGDMDDNIQKIKLSPNEKSNIALQGPGRKYYIRMNSMPHILKQKNNSRCWYNFNDTESNREVESITFKLSRTHNVDLDNPSSIDGLGLSYVRCCQSIFREIAVNVMRKDRNDKFIFKPTGVHGVYLLIFPGPKLRTGENISTIWFKLISSPEFIDLDELSTHWSFKNWNRDKEVLHTDWLSVDANRLDHYIRCYDRILMAYLSYCHSGTGHLDDYVADDKSNTLGTIICIYMEDKRSTSKMLQDVRYLVMGSLSKFRWWDELLDKYKEPIRTPLQAYLLKRLSVYSIEINKNLSFYIKSFKFGKVHQSSDLISDKLSGITSSLPRVLTIGSRIPFPQLLCEMYFTMLFNKNQDDPTHATFQILNKMLEGEKSLNEVKGGSSLHTGGNGSFDEIDTLIDNPHKNQFSARALMIGSKLQSVDPSNSSPAGLSHRKAAQNQLLNKPLSEFATYKSSAVLENKVFNNKLHTRRKLKTEHLDILEEEFREGTFDTEVENEHNKKQISKQNSRVRCIEGVMRLLQDGKMRSFDVIRSTINDEMYYQVFKKNQIGGTREILILPIEKRITINILESFSRLICKDDSREMLTHGDSKLSVMRDMIREIKRSPDIDRVILNYNLDKTKWGPSFMPIQFAYLFKPFAKFYPSLFRFITLTLMVHTNKKCLIPDKLLQVWLADSDNQLRHNDKSDDGPEKESLLQSLKVKFLLDKKIYFENESNMGQGILHYTSSFLHICALSFRDYIYKGLCLRKGLSTGVWKDIVSSDDSYTAQSIPVDNVDLINLRIKYFIKAQEVTERLFNIWTSKSKSSISFLINEFNSMFGSNLTLFPTLFKFGLASVMPFNTDSFFRMVKESFNVTRQIVENGGSLELYLIAHKLNKVYCESMYHTHVGGFNDFERMTLRRNFVPYQLGVYPIMHPGIMLILGPECHNYNIVDSLHLLSANELNLFHSTHTLIPINNPELYSEIDNYENIYTGLLRIEAAVGPIKKLQQIKRNIDMTWKQMNVMIDNDLLITMRSPITLEEIKLHTYLKLFSYGASEALRDTSASIYYARVCATVSSEAFQIPFHDTYKAKFDKHERRMIGHKYSDCISYLIHKKNDLIDLHQFYPNIKEFKDLTKLSQAIVEFIPRNPFESQNIKSLQLNEITLRIKNPIRNLIDSFWIKNEEDKPTSFFRDWINLKEMMPMIQDSLQGTLDQIPGDKTTKVKILLLILMRIMGYASKPMKAVIYGSSSRTYDHSFLTLYQQNSFHNFTSETNIMINSSTFNPQMYDELYLIYNYFALHLISNCGRVHDISINPNVINLYLRDNFISKVAKKKIMIMLMYFGYLDNISLWTDKTKTIIHFWVKRQIRIDDSYRGNFSLVCQCGENKIRFEKLGRAYRVTLSTSNNPSLNYELLKHAGELTMMSIEDILNNLPPGGFLVMADRIHSTNTLAGKKIFLDEIKDIEYNTGDVVITVDNDINFLSLINQDGFQIIKTPLGLLPTDYKDFGDELPDFDINGIKFSDLAKFGLFSVNFNYENMVCSDMLEMLNDLKVNRPKISEITKERLRGLISEEWETKSITEVLNESDEFVEEPIDFMTELINTTLSDGIIDTLGSEYDPYNDLFTDFDDIGIISSLPVLKIQHQPQRILERILNLKYQLISRCCLDVRLLSKNSIKGIYKITRNRNIVLSLVHVYDSMFSSVDISSPSGCKININPDFLNKFMDDDEDFEIL